MKVFLLFTLVLHVQPSPDMKIIIHLHEGPAPGVEAAPEEGVDGAEFESWGSGDYWPGGFGSPCRDTRCVCINPFHSKVTGVKVRGDPDDMCRRHNMCYVDCNSSCRDVQNAKGFGRCYSKLACEDRGPYAVPQSPCRVNETC